MSKRLLAGPAVANASFETLNVAFLTGSLINVVLTNLELLSVSSYNFHADFILNAQAMTVFASRSNHLKFG